MSCLRNQLVVLQEERNQPRSLRSARVLRRCHGLVVVIEVATETDVVATNRVIATTAVETETEAEIGIGIGIQIDLGIMMIAQGGAEVDTDQVAGAGVIEVPPRRLFPRAFTVLLPATASQSSFPTKHTKLGVQESEQKCRWAHVLSLYGSARRAPPLRARRKQYLLRLYQ
jgi:hypothetical protein